MDILVKPHTDIARVQPAVSGALVFVCEGPPSPEEQERLSRFLAETPGISVLAIQLGSAGSPWPSGCGRRISLPLGQQHWETACEIGMQVCLNEGHARVGTLCSLDPEDFSMALFCLEALAQGVTDAVLIKADGPGRDTLYVSERAAFACSYWGGLAKMSAALRRDALALIFKDVGRTLSILNGGETVLRPLPPSNYVIAQLQREAQELFRVVGMKIGTVPPPRSPPVRKIAVITPYYKEPDAELERCLGSVRDQSHACDHIMVSDGFPNPIVQRSGAMHIELGVGHSDNGNTPRYVGGLVALALGYDGLAYLDADNWFERHHIRRLVEAQHRSAANAVCSMRNIFLPDGYKLPDMDDEDVKRLHVDTSCYLLTRDCEFVIHLWGQMPKSWGPACDRVVFSALLGQRLEWTTNRTLNFKSNYAVHFKRAGRPVPDNVHSVPVKLWKAFFYQPPEFVAESVNRTGRLFSIIYPYLQRKTQRRS